MSHPRYCIFLIVAAIICCIDSSFAELPQAEVERLTRIIERKIDAPDAPDAYGYTWNIKVERACAEALHGKAYSVLEAALRMDLSSQIHALDLIAQIPIQERKAILLSALEDSRVWPYAPDELRFDPGTTHYIAYIFQQDFCRIVSETFKVPANYPTDPLMWSKADRADLAAKIRATGDPAIPLKPQNETVLPPAPQPEPNIPGAPTPTAPEQKPDAPIPNPLGSVWWTAIGIAAVLLAAWFGKRK